VPWDFGGLVTGLSASWVMLVALAWNAPILRGENGPDLSVWVLPSDSYEGGTPGEHRDPGTLTGNLGRQNHQLPESFDPDVNRTVPIWCLRFSVTFAAGPLELMQPRKLSE